MTLQEAGEIIAYWDDNPPPHLMLQLIARLLGWRPPADSAMAADLAAAPPHGLAVSRGEGLGMPPPLDVAALRRVNRARAVAGRNATPAADPDAAAQPSPRSR